ncbi:uncharacterized protein TrAtP1_010469 [Trichoderma atroviride]|uniref:uncharacterized protein n=1 Tax=Hypocrea atroviridis TaxID=63577 RepID=UPI00332591C0|nr:hypothetical protein TrAtP1_010469 [Trichoderma atroviride]
MSLYTNSDRQAHAACREALCHVYTLECRVSHHIRPSLPQGFLTQGHLHVLDVPEKSLHHQEIRARKDALPRKIMMSADELMVMRRKISRPRWMRRKEKDAAV